MKISNLFMDDDAVSPVIGVILMVAITVILAAVIGAFVLNIGGSQEDAPQVTWDWSNDAANDKVVLKHGGGDKINNANQIEVKFDATTGSGGSVTPTDDGKTLDSTDLFDSNTISAGANADVNTDDGSTSSTGTIELVWSSSDGSSSQIISTHEYDHT